MNSIYTDAIGWSLMSISFFAMSIWTLKAYRLEKKNRDLDINTKIFGLSVIFFSLVAGITCFAPVVHSIKLLIKESGVIMDRQLVVFFLLVLATIFSAGVFIISVIQYFRDGKANGMRLFRVSCINTFAITTAIFLYGAIITWWSISP